MVDEKLKYYGGNGYLGNPEIGEYKVKTESSSKNFKSLSKAKKYFDNLDEPKALWNIKTMELLDCYEN